MTKMSQNNELKTNYEKYLTDTTEFNAQQLYLLQLLRRWDEIDKVSVMNDLPTFYRLLKTFWINIRYRIQQKIYTDYEKFKIDETKINLKFEKAENLIFQNIKEIKKEQLSLAEKILRELQQLFIEMLFRSGTIFPTFHKDYDWKDEEKRNFL